MRIAIGSDHRGVSVKLRLVERLMLEGHDVEDVGPEELNNVDYPDYAAAVARRVAHGESDRGILVCGSGIGMCIAANKVPGVRAATCHDELTAEMSRRHNDVNVLCISADMLGDLTINRMIDVWLATDFDGGRHVRRLDKIRRLEEGRPLVDPDPTRESV